MDDRSTIMCLVSEAGYSRGVAGLPLPDLSVQPPEVRAAYELGRVFGLADRAADNGTCRCGQHEVAEYGHLCPSCCLDGVAPELLSC